MSKYAGNNRITRLRASIRSSATVAPCRQLRPYSNPLIAMKSGMWNV
jgi:hypothetical protein